MCIFGSAIVSISCFFNVKNVNNSDPQLQDIVMDIVLLLLLFPDRLQELATRMQLIYAS